MSRDVAGGLVEPHLTLFLVFIPSPKLQPIINPHPSLSDPSQELHYFRDTQGNWRQIRGRALAEELVQSAEAAGQKDEVLRWDDDRAVKWERQELEGVLVDAGSEGRRYDGQLEQQQQQQ